MAPRIRFSVGCYFISVFSGFLRPSSTVWHTVPRFLRLIVHLGADGPDLKKHERLFRLEVWL